MSTVTAVAAAVVWAAWAAWISDPACLSKSYEKAPRLRGFFCACDWLIDDRNRIAEAVGKNAIGDWLHFVSAQISSTESIGNAWNILIARAAIDISVGT